MDNPYPKLDHRQYKRVQHLFRSNYDTPEGRRMICIQLCDLGFFSEISADPEKVALQNHAKHLLRLCGIFEKGKEQMIVDALFDRVPLGGPEEEEEVEGEEDDAESV
ncbi:MAG: hypothetical protein JXQ30_08770 [Spirochaetes bacterium]|nr:hypothetical protein [Spirochaetota bacterium]